MKSQESTEQGEEFLAGAIERLKDLLPTDLASSEIREHYARDILERSVFSARMMAEGYLATIRETSAAVLDGSINEATARTILEDELASLGFSPLDSSSIENHASLRRVSLIIETQTKMASSLARLSEQTDAVVSMWPAWRLERQEQRHKPRADWKKRWIAAGDSVGWKGAIKPGFLEDFVALKDSPIWQALGNGVGGFKDTLGNPYPPFAYSSGMGWSDVSADEAASLGLTPSASSLSGGAGAEPASFASDFAALDPTELIASARRHGIIV